jgi:hypothetical protein
VGWWRECGCELGFEGRGLRLESIDGWWWGLVYCYGDALGYVHLVYGLWSTHGLLRTEGNTLYLITRPNKPAHHTPPAPHH